MNITGKAKVLGLIGHPVEHSMSPVLHHTLADILGHEIAYVPFDVKRVYYLYDVPGGENRGSHAHKNLSQLIIAASGSFRVTLDDGKCKRSFFLNRPYQGLYVKPGMWRDLEDFSSGAVCMVLASEVYQAEDYIRDYDEFIKYRNED